MFVIIAPTPVLRKSSGGQVSQGPCRWLSKPPGLVPSTPLCGKQRGPRGGEEERNRPCQPARHSLKHTEDPVGGQGLSHGPGAIVPDPVALEAVEARRGITGGAQEGARQALTPHTQPVGELALPTAALASGLPWGLQAPACGQGCGQGAPDNWTTRSSTV